MFSISTSLAEFKQRYGLVILVVIVALAMDAFTIPPWMYVYWPDWTLLVVIYWCLALPHHLNIKFAWFVGILVDIMKGSLLGQNALLYTLVAYATVLLHPRLRLYPPHQQTIYIALVLTLYTLLTIWIDNLRLDSEQTLSRLLSVIPSTVAWLWVFAVLRHLRQKFYSAAQG